MTGGEKIKGLKKVLEALSQNVGNSYTARGMARRQCEAMLSDLKKFGKCVNVPDNAAVYIRQYKLGEL